MLDKIKYLLGLTDSEKDNQIEFHITMIQETILDFCNLKELNKALENFIVTKVFEIMKSKSFGNHKTSQFQQEVASVTRGDTTFKYKTSSNNTVLISSSESLTDEEFKFLKQFRKMRMF